MSELSFLIELLLNHELPKETKSLLASRIKEVEQGLSQAPQPVVAYRATGNIVGQAPSTLALMEKHGALPPIAVPVEQIAQTPATAAALSDRSNQIAAALSGKAPPRGRNFK